MFCSFSAPLLAAEAALALSSETVTQGTNIVSHHSIIASTSAQDKFHLHEGILDTTTAITSGLKGLHKIRETTRSTGSQIIWPLEMVLSKSRQCSFAWQRNQFPHPARDSHGTTTRGENPPGPDNTNPYGQIVGGALSVDNIFRKQLKRQSKMVHGLRQCYRKTGVE